jgi:HD-like signal output (HDOD) protein
MAAATQTILNMAEHDAAALVLSLRADRVAGDSELPCFPQTAIRLQRLLADEDVSLEEIIKVISFDPVITGRVLQLANSAAFNTTGRRIGDLKTAVARLGFDLTRTAAIAHGMQQLVRAQANGEIRAHLEGLWERSAWMAAVAYVVAKNFTKLNRDQAMLGGLLHGVGKLYVLTRAMKFPFAMQDRDRFKAITREWQRASARNVLTAWKIHPDVVSAVSDFEDLNRTAHDEPDQTDVLTVSYLLIGYVGRLQALAPSVDKVKAFARMHLKFDIMEDAMTAAQEEIELIRRSIA